MQQQGMGMRWTAVILIAGVTLSACTPRDDSATADALGGANAIGAAELSEAAALGTVAAIHSAEVASAELAVERAQSARVRELAQRIAAEHEAYLERLRALNVAYDTTAADPSLVQMADSALQRLRDLPAIAFDSAWVNAQVAMHEAALLRLDGMAGLSGATGPDAALGGAPSSPAGGEAAQPRSQASGSLPPVEPGGTTGEGNVGEYLQNTRLLIQQHLQSARELQQALGGATAGQ